MGVHLTRFYFILLFWNFSDRCSVLSQVKTAVNPIVLSTILTNVTSGSLRIPIVPSTISTTTMATKLPLKPEVQPVIAPINVPIPSILQFPQVSLPELQKSFVDRALKSALRRMVETQSTEQKGMLNKTSEGPPAEFMGSGPPVTPYDLANVENRLLPDAKKSSQIAYILEEMTYFLINASSLTREQIIFGLPKLTVGHPTISRRCPYNPNPPITCELTEFRTMNGQCNNAQNPWWGAALSPYSRFLPHNYVDGVRAVPASAIDGSTLPNPRFISSSVHWSLPGTHPYITQMVTSWAQFIEHDVSHTAAYYGTELIPLNCCKSAMKSHPECFALEVNASDSFYEETDVSCMNYVRSAIAPKHGCVMGPRDQMNQATHFLDASTIYGSSEQDSQRLRELSGGRLWMTDFENGKSLLQELVNNTDCRPATDPSSSCFDSGDVRANENLPVAVMYTLFAREHNRLATELGKLNPHWGDEQLFQSARKIVIGLIQHITFSEFLPLVLGRDSQREHNAEPVNHGFYRGYSSDNNPGISNEFATAAIKFWHTLFTNHSKLIDRRGREIWKLFTNQWFQPYDLYFSGVFDGIVRGLTTQSARPGDQSVSSALTMDWLRVGNNSGTGLDLVGLTIQRGRDHGLSGYNSWREACGLPRAKTFEDLHDVISDSNIQILKVIYNSINDVDLYSGALCEKPVSGGIVGPVFACIIGKQFSNLRRSDRFWYETDMPQSSFTLDQLNEIRTTSLARVLCDNSDAIPMMHPRVMIQPDGLLNAPLTCKSAFIPSIDLKLWKEAAPLEPAIPTEILMNILEKAREDVKATAEEDLSRVRAPNGKSRRTSATTPTESVRLLHLESSAFLLATKNLLKREIAVSRSPSNMSTSMAKIRRFNALIKSKSEGPKESANCTERLAPCDHTSKFRTYSGWCNNVNHPEWGSSERIYGRTLDPAYFDGIDEPRNTSVTGTVLPSAREVSQGVLTDKDVPHPRYSHMLMQWGQFLDHDISLTPIATASDGLNFNCRGCDSQKQVSNNCRPISISDTDKTMSPFLNGTSGERRCLAFIRSAIGRTAFGAREQLNQHSAYIDGGQIYGFSMCRAIRLRAFIDGKLNSTKQLDGSNDLLPTTVNREDVEVLECQNTVPGNLCFLAGDPRENENPGLAVVQTIWMRFHNEVAKELKRLNAVWDDERLYQESRRIVVAVFQHTSFNEYLPRILGQAITNSAGLSLKKTGYYKDYDPTCDATIANEFSAAAFRFGHSLVQGQFGRYNNDLSPGNNSRVNLFEHYHRSDLLFEHFGVDKILIGLTLEAMQNADFIVSKALTDRLFEDRGRQFSGQDLAAINVMRGRDHGVPSYNEFREHCNLTRAVDFADLTSYIPVEAAASMAKVYQHVDDIDLYVGGLSEFAVYGGVVGPTFACILAEQFFRTRKCDRFWYEADNPVLRFSEDQLRSIRRMTIAKVLCDNSDTMDRIQRSVLDLPDTYINPYVKCDDLPGLDLSLWQERPSCNVSGVFIPIGRSVRVSPCHACTCTKEGPFCQSVVVRNCETLKNSFPLVELLADTICKAQCSSLTSAKDILPLSNFFVPFM